MCMSSALFPQKIENSVQLVCMCWGTLHIGEFMKKNTDMETRLISCERLFFYKLPERVLQNALAIR